MSSLPNASVSEPAQSSHALDGDTNRAETLARLVIREGKQFRSSAIEAGYSRAVAKNGLKQLMSQSAVVSTAIQREWDRIHIGLDKLKPFAVRRLYSEIVDPESNNAMRAIEIAGRFKETDWFVRHSETNLGIFINLADSPPQVNDIDTFKE